MEQRPEQPPEGKLIADAADRMNLSIREAARRAGISYGRWRQIVTGYQNISPGSFAAVHAPARTVAKMAAVVGITPGEMETEGGRPDVAEAMREIAGGPDSFPPVSDELKADMQSHLAEVEIRLEIARRRHPGKVPTGADVFPADSRLARTWDAVAAIGWKPESVARGVAVMMADQEAAEAEHNRRASGLPAPRIAAR